VLIFVGGLIKTLSKLPIKTKKSLKFDERSSRTQTVAIVLIHIKDFQCPFLLFGMELLCM